MFWGYINNACQHQTPNPLNINVLAYPGILLIREWAGLPGKPPDSREGWPTHKYWLAREYKNKIPPEARSWIGLPGNVITKCSNLVMVHGR